MSSLFTPEAPENGRPDPVVPTGPPPTMPPSRKGLFGWIQRNPKRAFWTIAAAALFVGIAIGAASADQQAAVDAANARADRAEQRVGVLDATLQDTEDKAASAQDRADDLAADVKKLRAKGEVPSFIGDDISDAQTADAVDSYDWNIRTVRQISDEDPGTVIGQQPAEGATMKAGRSITLTVAKKAPPKPKQWITVDTLSGASSTKTPEFTVPEGAKARLVYNMPQDGNNAITLYQAPDEYVDLLLNEIGPQSGTTRLYTPGTFYLDVTGAYDISVQVFKRP
jgi:hypothetical protein